MTVGGAYQLLQNFTTSGSNTMNSIQIYDYANTGSQSTTNFYIYAASGSKPTGGILSSGSLASMTASAWNAITMSSYTLTAGNYVIVATMPAGSSSNYWVWANATGSG